MALPRSLARSVPFGLVVLLLASCGGSSDGTAETTVAPTTTEATPITTIAAPTTTTTAPTTTLFIADTATVTHLVDQWLAGWNNSDADVIVSVFADDFYFKGICGACAVRTDTASMHSYAEALFGIELQMERTTDLQDTPDGAHTFEATVCTLEDGHIAGIEIQSDGDKITRLVTVEWDKFDCP